MPFHAYNPSRDVVSTEDVGTSAEVYCTACEEPLSVVSAHSRDENFVPKHFRHLPSSSPGGECGGGESDRHEEMKLIALSKLRYEFDLAKATDEQRIGDQYADAYGRLEEPRAPYGNGFAIEVQYRNESKDLGETTEGYLDHGYTTIWLWEDQFDDRDVNLFGGTVVMPWPNAVPEQSEWSGYGENATARDRWRHLWRQGEFNSGAPAKLPSEFSDKLAQTLWNERDWESLFNPADTSSYLAQCMATPQAGKKHLCANLPAECVRELAEQIWRSQPWESLFDEEENTPGQPAVELDIPFNIMFADHQWFSWWHQGNAEKAANVEKPPNPFDDVQCWKCETYWHADRGLMQCPSCGTAVDWAWNVSTGRIGQEALPDGVSVESALHQY